MLVIRFETQQWSRFRLMVMSQVSYVATKWWKKKSRFCNATQIDELATWPIQREKNEIETQIKKISLLFHHTAKWKLAYYDWSIQCNRTINGRHKKNESNLENRIAKILLYWDEFLLESNKKDWSEIEEHQENR